MLSFAPNTRIFLHSRPTDMRKTFDGLCGLVRGVLQADPLDGSLFLFANRRGDRLKALWWDQDGLALFYKRSGSPVAATLSRFAFADVPNAAIADSRVTVILAVLAGRGRESLAAQPFTARTNGTPPSGPVRLGSTLVSPRTVTD